MFYYFFLFPQIKMAFLINIKRQAINSNKSVGDLEVGASYQILAMSVVETKFGKSKACKLTDSDSGGHYQYILTEAHSNNLR